ncbi:MarR family transcriptional regulator [Ferrovibrio sp. MS7]|uniref:MarR family winged helix-turn-helix transcriptional regulator n=1 Tax=Ferrovibrio TaxID=1231242 RepID=UPI0031363233
MAVTPLHDMPLEAPTPEPEVAAKTMLAQRVTLLLDRLGRLTRELQFVDGLNPAQWEVLRFLAQANRYSRTPSALADYLGSTKGTVSQTLIALENKGLVDRVKKTCDRRGVELRLTDEGRAMLARDPMRTLEKAIDDMAMDCGASLVRGLSKLLYELQNRHSVMQYGICQDCSLFCVNHLTPAETTHHCGKTGDALSHTDRNQLCVSYKSHDTAGSAE